MDTVYKKIWLALLAIISTSCVHESHATKSGLVAGALVPFMVFVAWKNSNRFDFKKQNYNKKVLPLFSSHQPLKSTKKPSFDKAVIENNSKRSSFAKGNDDNKRLQQEVKKGNKI